MKILLIDDDVVLLEALELGLRLEWDDVQVVCAADGEAGVEAFFEASPDVVLLDVGLPHENGFDVLQEIRRVSDVPVIMLTARGADTDQVRGLELGADDYVVKPFSRLALMARIRAVLRRYELAPPLRGVPDFVAGDLAVHFRTQQVTLAGQPVKLTPIEYRLLYHLVRHAGHLMPHSALLDRVWGSEASPGAEHLKVFVSRVRAKLRRPGGPEYIHTERGLGYRFVRPPGGGSHHS
jgi:DNA-binding response OmpR family regulator